MRDANRPEARCIIISLILLNYELCERDITLIIHTNINAVYNYNYILIEIFKNSNNSQWHSSQIVWNTVELSNKFNCVWCDIIQPFNMMMFDGPFYVVWFCNTGAMLVAYTGTEHTVHIISSDNIYTSEMHSWTVHWLQTLLDRSMHTRSIEKFPIRAAIAFSVYCVP